MQEISIREYENDSLTGTYVTIIDSGDDVLANKLLIRNTTLNRIRLRFDENDEDTISIQPDEKMVLGGLSKMKAKKIEAKTETDIPQSLKINLFN